MLQRLDYEEDKPDDQRRKPEVIRREFDQLLGVDQWDAPLKPERTQDASEPAAPSWWVSDEEASAPWVAMAGLG